METKVRKNRFNRVCRFFTSGSSFQATETILATGTTIWKPGYKPGFQIVVPVARIVTYVTYVTYVTVAVWESDMSDTFFIIRSNYAIEPPFVTSWSTLLHKKAKL